MQTVCMQENTRATEVSSSGQAIGFIYCKVVRLYRVIGYVDSEDDIVNNIRYLVLFKTIK